MMHAQTPFESRPANAFRVYIKKSILTRGQLEIGEEAREGGRNERL